MAETDAELKFKQDFIDRVRAARSSTGQKQWQVALALDVPQDRYKHWEQQGEKGRLMPHHLIPRFCYATHVDPSWLMTGHGKMKGTPGPEAVEAPERPVRHTKRLSKRRARSAA